MRLYVGIKDYREAQPASTADFRTTTAAPTLNDLHSVRVLEGASLDGTFEAFETVKLTAHDINYIEVHKYSDPASWFKAEFLDTAGTVLARTPPIMSEIIGGIVDAVRTDIGDTAENDPAFEDKEYMQYIRLALRRFKGEKNVSSIQDEDFPVIGVLTRIHLARVIAFDHAKYFQLQAPEAQLDKSQVMNHYLEIAKGLEEYWNEIKKDLGLSSGGRNDDNIISEMASPNVISASRVSMRTGRRIDSLNPIIRRPRFM